MRRWRRLRCLKDAAKDLGLILLALSMKAKEVLKKHSCLSVVVICILLVWLLYSRLDPCNGRIITANLCKDYFRGEVSGRLCSKLCREETVHLSMCVQNGERKSFWWDKMMMRVQGMVEQEGREPNLAEGMLPSEFLALLLDRLQMALGPGDFSGLARELKKFADFNEDGKLSLGEAQSLWRLVHDQEFLVLFIFQHSTVFPTFNGTCGSLFGFHFPDVNTLYNKDSFPLRLLSDNAYRWFLPTWEQRAKVAVGILDLMFDIYEDNHIKFFMCDIRPSVIGHSATYEALVTDARQVLSSTMLANALVNRTCSQDHHCHFSPYCTTMCDTLQRRCTGEVTKPTLWQACLLLKEYILFDAPDRIQPTLRRLLQRCSHLIIYGQSIDMSHSILITDLKTVLWDQVKNINVR